MMSSMNYADVTHSLYTLRDNDEPSRKALEFLSGCNVEPSSSVYELKRSNNSRLRIHVLYVEDIPREDRPSWLRGVPSLIAHETEKKYVGSDALTTLTMFKNVHDLAENPLVIPRPRTPELVPAPTEVFHPPPVPVVVADKMIPPAIQKPVPRIVPRPKSPIPLRTIPPVVKKPVSRILSPLPRSESLPKSIPKLQTATAASFPIAQRQPRPTVGAVVFQPGNPIGAQKKKKKAEFVSGSSCPPGSDM